MNLLVCSSLTNFARLELAVEWHIPSTPTLSICRCTGAKPGEVASVQLGIHTGLAAMKPAGKADSRQNEPTDGVWMGTAGENWGPQLKVTRADESRLWLPVCKHVYSASEITSDHITQVYLTICALTSTYTTVHI